MAHLEVLNILNHAALRVARADAGHRHFVPVVAAEFESVAARFPILFCKNSETGAFYAGAVLGFKPGENLAHDSADAQGANRLFDVVRDGFFVSGEDIAIDPAHPRLVGNVGEPLFESDGRPSAVLRSVQAALRNLHFGLAETDALISRLLSLKLVEPIDVSFSFDDGERLVLDGLYTISRDALAELTDDVVLGLFRTGALAQIYSMIASLQHFPRLARLRNDRLTGQ